MADAQRRTRTGTRAIIGALAANLALAAVVVGSQAGPGYVAVDDWSAAAQGTNGVRLSVTTNGAIPKQPDSFIGANAIVGFAWVDGDTSTALVATIHPVIGRDSNQRPDSWHLHTVTLSLVDPDGDDDPSPTDDACIVSIDSTPTAGINVQGSSLSVNLDRSSMPEGVGPDDIDLAAGFTVHPNTGCGSGLAVRIRT
jgi:hypothetical protein